MSATGAPSFATRQAPSFSHSSRLFLQIAIVFLAYFAAGKLGQATANLRSGNVGPVWPACGIALAATVLLGYRIWPAIAGAVFLLGYLAGVNPIAALGQAIGAALGAVLGAWLLRSLQFDKPHFRLHDVISFIIFGAFGSTLASSVVGTLILYARGMQSYPGLPREWLIYWLGDATGVLLITPLILTI